ncbi:MAG: uncharacterized protein KVP18_002369 [Porospora cf. gigantea A]|uniref:uncharacterized protein n=1 Tax=Porospora cf. gigantea A TaxID=2853593 RepID=UPI00355A7548|nr:MAG: hypothetical protein KVP18_002369 [Porospora cf. gigantea A]
MRRVNIATVAGGQLVKCVHPSSVTGTDMVFSVFLPHQAEYTDVPAVYFLSGLTCTDENFCQKAGAFEHANKQNLAVVVCDTSPRGSDLPDEHSSYDFGSGAGFYLDATEEPWKSSYRMYTYVTEELPALVEAEFAVVPGLKSIFGHSMGGHGALMIALKNPDAYASVSAFAPICNPTKCPWGIKAFEGYLGSVDSGVEYDSCELLKTNGPQKALGTILVDVGLVDEHASQLRIDEFEAECRSVGQATRIRRQPGHGHSYYFVSTFVSDHIDHHARALHTRLPLAPVVEFDTAAQPIRCRAAVARAPKAPLDVVDVIVAPPKAGEVRLKVVSNALCHTDIYTLSGQDPEGLFPCILGHEAGCIVESVGSGVLSVKPGDHVVPCYTPQCNASDCVFCMSPKTNLCPRIRATQGRGVMPDGTSRFTGPDGETLYHFMGCSTFSEYTVVAEISCAKIDRRCPMEQACLFGCGVSTGFGAVWNNAKVEANSTVAVWGMGAVGLAVVQAAKIAGARRIFAVDLNSAKFTAATKLGATDCLNPSEHTKPMNEVLVGLTGWGVDYTFDCTGNVNVMRQALEAAHRGWGLSCVIGVAASGQEIATRPFQLVTGRRWIGTAFGGWKGRTDVPKLVTRSIEGELPVDHFITHRFEGVEAIEDAVGALHDGACLRAVVKY